MKKNVAYGGLLFSLVILCAFGCVRKSETDDSGSQKAQNDFVQSMDEYHRILRPLMHQALPQKNASAFREHAAQLLQSAEEVAAADIPSKFSDRENEIRGLVNVVVENTRVFAKTCETGTNDEIFDAFMSAHDKYEALADIVYRL